jgi:hypothetical protein
MSYRSRRGGEVMSPSKEEKEWWRLPRLIPWEERKIPAEPEEACEAETRHLIVRWGRDKVFHEVAWIKKAGAPQKGRGNRKRPWNEKILVWVAVYFFRRYKASGASDTAVCKQLAEWRRRHVREDGHLSKIPESEHAIRKIYVRFANHIWPARAFAATFRHANYYWPQPEFRGRAVVCGYRHFCLDRSDDKSRKIPFFVINARCQSHLISSHLAMRFTDVGSLPISKRAANCH